MSRPGKYSTLTESGAVFCLVGLASIYFATRYPIGTIDRVGAGFFPLVLACILTVLGVALLVLGLRGRGSDEETPSVDLRSFAITVGAILFFGFAIGRLGLLLTIPLTVFIASFAQKQVDWRLASIVAAVMTVFTLLVFSLGLDLRIPVLPRVG